MIMVGNSKSWRRCKKYGNMCSKSAQQIAENPNQMGWILNSNYI